MSSCAVSALVPSSRIVAPLTLTRPSSISCSAARREAIPARDKIFCNRSTSLSSYHEDAENTKFTKIRYALAVQANRFVFFEFFVFFVSS